MQEFANHLRRHDMRITTDCGGQPIPRGSSLCRIARVAKIDQHVGIKKQHVAARQS